MNAKEVIARRVAKEIKTGKVVNLGIGIPTMAISYMGKDIDVTLHSENGLIGLCDAAEHKNENLVDAGGQPCGIIAGGAVFDSLMSFSLVRGGHIDVAILGGLQVDQHGNLANWMIPGKMVPGMGGAMDLVIGAKSVIVAMEHCTSKGSAKLLKACTLPITAKGKVNIVITELGVFRLSSNCFVLEEIYPDVTVEFIKSKTEASLIISENLKIMKL